MMIVQALINLGYDGPVEVLEDGTINFQDEDLPRPSIDEIMAEADRLQADFDYHQYQRYRKPEYPSLQDLADAIYWQSQGDDSKMQAYVESVNAVKEKYPKPTIS
jgi:hypothetical protein